MREGGPGRKCLRLRVIRAKIDDEMSAFMETESNSSTMKLEWLREYRPLIGTLYRAANAYSQVCKAEGLGIDVKFSAYEVQIMEHVLEYYDQKKNMAWYADHLGLSPSNFSKYIKRLVKKGLVEKYHSSGNQKNVILMVSEKGMREYEAYQKYAQELWFNELFEQLDRLTPEELEAFQKIIETWGNWHATMVESPEEGQEKLIRIE